MKGSVRTLLAVVGVNCSTFAYDASAWGSIPNVISLNSVSLIAREAYAFNLFFNSAFVYFIS
jgi:hypothetical protein